MRNQIGIALVVFLLISTSSSPTNNIILVDGQGSQLFLPERVKLDTTLTSQFGNDVFFQPNADIAVLNHEIQSESSTFNLFSTDGMTRTSYGGYSTLDPFSISDISQLYQASNASSESLDLMLTATYFDLTGGIADKDGLQNIILYQDEMSGFRFEGTAGTPIVLNFELEGEANVQVMDVFLLSPSGMYWDYSAQYTDEFASYTNHFIPLVPPETGTYTFYLVAHGEDIILQNLELMDSPPVVDISNGYTAQIQGTHTQTTFFKLTAANDSSSPVIFDLSSQIFSNQNIGDSSLQAELLGELQLNYFASSTSAFGDDLPSTVVQWGDSEIYVAVTATPPNDGNQFIKNEKADLDLATGFDLEYAFWAETFDVPDFTVNEDFKVKAVDVPSTNYYFYTPNSEHLIGLNSTNAAEAVFYNLDNPELVYSLDSTTHNILESQNQLITVLPAGNYLVHVSDSIAGSTNLARVSTFSTQSIVPDSPTNFDFDLNSPVFYKLSVNTPRKEYFNFTYMDHLNMSVDMEFALYDSVGTPGLQGTYTFEDNPNTVDNNTLFGSTSLFTNYNTFQGFLRMDMTGNVLYNPNGSVNSTDLTDVSSTINIERLNYLNVWESNDPDRVFDAKDLSDGENTFLNESKSEIIYLYNFDSADTPTGYHMVFTSTNVTYRLLAFVDWTTTGSSPREWFDITVDTAQVIDGIDHYSQILEFGTTDVTSFAFVLIFDTAGASNNGTYTTSLDTITPQTLPQVSLESLGTVKYDVPDQTIPGGDQTGDTDTNSTEGGLSDLLTNPWTYVGIAGVAAVIGAIVYFLRSRGKFPV